MGYSELKTALNATGIPFAEESWVSAPATDYGVVALTGSENNRYADDVLIMRESDAEVHLYTYGDGNTHAAQVDTAIRACDCTVHSIQREFLQEYRMMHYRWQVNIITFEV